MDMIGLKGPCKSWVVAGPRKTASFLFCPGLCALVYTLVLFVRDANYGLYAFAWWEYGCVPQNGRRSLHALN